MQHLEAVTRHAIQNGTKADIADGFSPSLITAGFLRAAFSQEALISGVSETVLSLIDRDLDAVRASNQLLLRFGEDLCPGLDPGCLKKLVGIIKGHIGVGKGTFFAAMKHMPEDFAMVQLNQWLRDSSLNGMDIGLYQSTLEHALSLGRYHVAHAMCAQMLLRGADSEIETILIRQPYEKIERAALGKYMSQQRMVELLCDMKSFQQAQVAAGEDVHLDQVLRANVAKYLRLKTPAHNWVDLFSKLTEQMDELIDQQLLIDRHKSAAMVIFNKITKLSKESVEQQINTDRLKVFAYQLGVTDVIGSLRPGAARDQVFAQDLGL